MTTDSLFEDIESENDDSQVSLPAYEILTYPADYTLEVLVEKWRKNDIKVPTLQRGYVWNQAKASKLIESFLLGLPVPPVFLYQDRKDNSLLVIDGHQRLRSIFYFFTGLFGESNSKKSKTFRLEGLYKKSPYLGKTYEWLKKEDNKAFNKLNNSVLRAFLMKQIDPADDTSIFQVFERLNSGGVALNSQEIRNCLYEGTLNHLLKELNDVPEWREIVGRKSVDTRMRDVELILRLLALLDGVSNYESPMKKFLNDFMEENKKLVEDQSRNFSNIFKDTSVAVLRNLGKRPFHVHRGLNLAVCDSVFIAFARHVRSHRKDHNSGDLRKRYEKLLEDPAYIEKTSKATTNTEVVTTRIEIAEKFLFGK